MGIHWPLILLACLGMLLPGMANAQDGQYLRDLQRGEFKSKIGRSTNRYSFILESMLYELDLNQDGSKEGIIFEQRDGESWIVLYSSQGRKLGEFKFMTVGRYAAPVLLRLRVLGPQVTVLAIAFKEGENSYMEFSNTIRWYFLLMEDLHFNSMDLVPGPLMAEERLDFQRRYTRRGSHLQFKDLNQDGILDIVVAYRSIQRAYLYRHHTLEAL